MAGGRGGGQTQNHCDSRVLTNSKRFHGPRGVTSSGGPPGVPALDPKSPGAAGCRVGPSPEKAGSGPGLRAGGLAHAVWAFSLFSAFILGALWRGRFGPAGKDADWHVVGQSFKPRTNLERRQGCPGVRSTLRRPLLRAMQIICWEIGASSSALPPALLKAGLPKL